MTDRVLYIGTDDGLYEADGGEPRLLGLKGKGMIASPVVVDVRDPRRLFAGTYRGGVFRSDDAGQSWRAIDSGLTSKEVWCIAQHPRTAELWAGTGPSGIYKSAGGERWEECEQLRTLPTTKEWDFPGPPFISHVRGLGLCAEDPNLVLGAVEVGWLVRSRDGGSTWENIQAGVFKDSHSATFMPGDPSTVVATSGGGVYRSTDGGDSFERSSDGIDRTYMVQLALCPKRPQVLFTAGSIGSPGHIRGLPNGADAGVFRSEDQGRSWRRLTNGFPEVMKAPPRYVAADPDDPDWVCVGFGDGSVWASENGGESFRRMIEGLPRIGGIRVTRR
jgi:photosystem II stability/assembly factor-like uncharacterized protein